MASVQDLGKCRASIVAGLIVEMLFMLFSWIYNGLKISEYKAYWLTDFLVINNWVRAKKDFC